MPFIYLHLAIARDAASKLQRQEIDGRLGDYLLGATLPDAHIIRGSSREQTHFLSLDAGPAETGVRSFLKTYPDLVQEATKHEAGALVAGYLCHLVTDEAWIRDIYRPCFGAGSPLGNDPLVRLMDRALQYEMDMREQQDSSAGRVRELVCNWTGNTEVPFIDSATLLRWQQVVCTATTRKSSWEGFRGFASRFLVTRNALSAEQLERFLASPSDTLERILSVVTEARLSQFRSNAVANAVAAAREYLC